MAASPISCESHEVAVVQPIEFNHAAHAKEGMGCLDCHSKADQKPYASFPSVKQCLLCHSEEETEEEVKDNPAAQRKRAAGIKLREYAAADEGVPWVTVNRVVGHVYFSHVAHVRFAKLKCDECHGDMSAMTKPPEHSQIEHLTMRRCMECHAERGTSNDCLVCHK